MTEKQYQEIFVMLNKALQSNQGLLLLPLKCQCGNSFFHANAGEMEEHNQHQYAEEEAECGRCGRMRRVFMQHTGYDEEEE